MKVEEVKEVILSLKNKKAPGYDGITAEHFMFGGNKLLAILASICNSITETKYFPTQM